jgi:uncharacterized membrane protein YecN with MAPEG domain
MQPHALVALVTLLSLVTYFAFSITTGVMRSRHRIVAPAVTGHPSFERALRIQSNTLEWLPLYLVSLWLFAIYWNDHAAALLGLVWIVGRIIYGVTYLADPAKRGIGFLIQALATMVLLFGALGRVIYVLTVRGA